MARKSAAGNGTIRKKTVLRNGKEYTYWEARFTTGYDPGTGKQIQRSITGKTQKEVAKKLKEATLTVDQGTYTDPVKLTLNVWLDSWLQDYLIGVKPNTIRIYRNNIERHIKPAMGAVRLHEIRPHIVQRFVNKLALSPASIRLAYKVLHQALEKAVQLGYIPKNPAENCELPRQEQTEIHPIDDANVSKLLKAAAGDQIEALIILDLFSGLRQSELLGLTWDCVDLKSGALIVNRQLVRSDLRVNEEVFASPKNGKSRTITIATSAIKVLREQKRRQAEMKIKAGPAWENEHNLVFTNQLGHPLTHQFVDRSFKRLIKKAGFDGVRFHDLRHTYAVNAIRAGDDIKTIQSNLGHASAAFTLDRYGHFTERMRQDSAARMEGFIKNVLNL